jgi:alkylated DNA nucleotide flippase Atl1
VPPLPGSTSRTGKARNASRSGAGAGGAARRAAPGEPTPFAERVLDVVRLIPRGRVLSYGDVAEYLGEGGPRAVGTVLARFGGGTPWHRVVRADGTPNPAHPTEAAALLRRERVPFRDERVDMRRARWTGAER